MKKKIENLNDIVGKDAIYILEKNGVSSLDDFFEKCMKHFFWGELSAELKKSDRKKLEKFLLENTTVDTFAYYRRDPYQDHLVKYESLLTDDGNWKIISSPHITSEHIIIDRLKRTVDICVKNDLADEFKISIDVPYQQIEMFFAELESERYKMDNLHAFAEVTHTKKITLTHLNRKTDIFGPLIITNEFDVKKRLKNNGL